MTNDEAKRILNDLHRDHSDAALEGATFLLNFHSAVKESSGSIAQLRLALSEPFVAKLMNAYCIVHRVSMPNILSACIAVARATDLATSLSVADLPSESDAKATASHQFTKDLIERLAKR